MNRRDFFRGAIAGALLGLARSLPAPLRGSEPPRTPVGRQVTITRSGGGFAEAGDLIRFFSEGGGGHYIVMSATGHDLHVVPVPVPR